MFINGVEILTEQQLEEAIVDMNQESKTYMRNMFNGIDNTPAVNIPDVTPRQIRLALLGVGITEAMIDNIINSLSSPTKEAAMIAWKYSTAFQRNNALVPIVAQMLQYNSQQLDQLWLTAGTL